MKNKLFHISYEKERLDTLKLVDIIKNDNWIDESTIIVICSPEYSSFTGQLINHKLSFLNKNELFEMLYLEIPYPITPQVWNRETSEIQSFDRYLIDWMYKYTTSAFKYLFVDSCTMNHSLGKLRHLLRNKVDFKIASVYSEEKVANISDYCVEVYNEEDKGQLIFEWENDNNINWK